MERPAGCYMRILVPAFLLAWMWANPAIAQEKSGQPKKEAQAATGKPTVLLLHEDQRVRVLEATYRPGDEGARAARAFRVIRVMEGGTIQRTFADGKVEKVEFRTGQVVTSGPDAVYTPKNIGKTTVVLYVVQLKDQN
jgi:mannose-6-phosphate isomerase-like protein (cupin superfamily)